MHAPNSDPITITTLSAPTPTPCPEMSENVRKCPTNDDFHLPILTSQPLPSLLSSSTLIPRQLAAISLLCSGKNLEQVAVILGLSPRTLYRWRHSHPAFRAELARRQRELHDTAARRLRLTLLHAISALTSQINDAQYRADRAKAAISLLRHCDLPSLLSLDSDPLTPAACLDDQIRQDRSSRNLDPDLPIDDQDRLDYLSRLQSEDALDVPPPPPPTHRRLVGTPRISPTPYPTPSNDSPDPEFQI